MNSLNDLQTDASQTTVSKVAKALAETYFLRWNGHLAIECDHQIFKVALTNGEITGIQDEIIHQNGTNKTIEEHAGSTSEPDSFESNTQRSVTSRFLNIFSNSNVHIERFSETLEHVQPIDLPFARLLLDGLQRCRFLPILQAFGAGDEQPLRCIESLPIALNDEEQRCLDACNGSHSIRQIAKSIHNLSILHAFLLLHWVKRQPTQTQSSLREPTPSPEIDYFQILNLSPHATAPEIEGAYLHAKKPSLCTQPIEIKRVFDPYFDAYFVLSHPTLRARYSDALQTSVTK